MNKIKKIIIFVVILLIVLTVNCYATTLTDIEDSAKKFLDAGKEAMDDANVDTNSITKEVVPIVQILSVIGVLVVGIAMVVLGIQWVMAKPSPEAQAKLKNKFVSLAVTAGVLFGSYTIWSIIVTIMDSIDG